jgi:uncharacterized protein YjbI with pentapeptide repeats
MEELLGLYGIYPDICHIIEDYTKFKDCKDIKTFRGESRELKNISMSGVELHDAKMIGYTFINVDLSFAHISHSDFSESKFINCDLSKAKITDMGLNKISFVDSNMEGINISNIGYSPRMLKNYRDWDDLFPEDLPYTTSKTYIQNCNLVDSELSSIYINDFDIKDCDLNRATINCCRFTLLRMDLNDFSDAKLDRVEIRESDVSRCNFAKSNFATSKLKMCDIYNCNFDEAKLLNSDLSRSCIDFCELDNAELSGSNMCHCEINDTHADLTNTRNNDTINEYIGFYQYCAKCREDDAYLSD